METVVKEKITELGTRITELKAQLQTMKNLVFHADIPLHLVLETSLLVSNGQFVLATAIHNDSSSIVSNIRLMVPDSNVTNRVYLRMATVGLRMEDQETWHPFTDMPPDSVGYALMLIDSSVCVEEDVSIDIFIKYTTQEDDPEEHQVAVPTFSLKPKDKEDESLHPFNMMTEATDRQLEVILLSVWLTSKNDLVKITVPRDASEVRDASVLKREVLKWILKTHFLFENASSRGLRGFLCRKGTAPSVELAGIMLCAKKQDSDSETTYAINISSRSMDQTLLLIKELLPQLPSRSLAYVSPPGPHPTPEQIKQHSVISQQADVSDTITKRMVASKDQVGQ